MFSNIKRNWWPTLVVAQIVLTAAAFVLAAIVTPDQQGSEVPPFRIVMGVIGVASIALLLAGLVTVGRNRTAGSWMIVAGSVPTLLTLIALNPVALLATATIATGLWTGNLAFRTRPAEIDPNEPGTALSARRGTQWSRWLVAAIALFALGFAVLLVFDSVDSSDAGEDTVAGGLMFFTWLLAWAAAAATGAIGVALGIMRLITRHRTRTA